MSRFFCTQKYFYNKKGPAKQVRDKQLLPEQVIIKL